MHDPTALERETSDLLESITAFLPDRVATMLWHDYRGAIFEEAAERQAGGLAPDEAMRLVLDGYWGRFLSLRARFLWMYKREIIQGWLDRVRAIVLRRSPPNLPKPLRHRGNFARYEAFLADLEARFGPELARQPIEWTSYHRCPGWEFEYLGSARTRHGLIAALALWPQTGQPNAQMLLLQKGVLRRPVANRRQIMLFAFEPAPDQMRRLGLQEGIDPEELEDYARGMRNRLTNERAGSVFVYYGDHEATIEVLSDAVGKLPEAEAVEGELEALCRGWLLTVGVERAVRLGPDDTDFWSEMRAMVPRRAWREFGLEPGRERLGR